MRSLDIAPVLGILALSVTGLLGACGGEDPAGDPSGGSPGAGGGGSGAGGSGGAGGMGALGCAEDLLPLQNPRSHTLGETFYLPRVRADAACAGLGWTVEQAPLGSEVEVFAAGAPEPRFTPDVAGEYTFRLADPAGTELRLGVAARAPAERYRNHFLTPLHGAALVDGELWTANGASYTVTRLGPDGQGGWAKLAEIPVGSWPGAIAHHPGSPHVLVAQRGSDTVGFVDRERGVLVDALWVGDEPSGLAISPDGARLYVSLATMRSVAVVDIEAREVVGRIEVGFDPRALAISPDGARLFVASYRSGNAVKDTRGSYGPEDDQDLWIVDTASLEIEAVVSGVSADLRAIALSEDGAELFVAATDGDPEPSQADPNALPFVHELIVIGADPAQPGFGEVLRRADLTRQPGSGGPVVNPAGVLVSGDRVWVSSESSDIVVGLDRTTLAEVARIPVGPGARKLVRLDDAGHFAVHTYQSFEAWILDEAGAVQQTLPLADDPRPAEVALGERVFTRPGGGFAENHACSSCHVEAQNDGMIWRFGPSIWHNVRPLQLLAATTPLEWGAYVSSADNFGYQGPSAIVRRPATPEEAIGLQSFLESLLGAPPATGWTRVDGSYTEAALRGKALFEGKALCSGCHEPPLYTNRRMIESGKSGEPADVPSLLGAYRHGVYFVKGQARSLDDAVDVAIAYIGAELTGEERADLLQFLRELTPKGAAPLAIWPDIDSSEGVYPDVRPGVGFAGAVDDTEGRTAAEVAGDYLVLEDETGDTVPGRVEIVGQRLDFVPDEPLEPGATYRFRVREGLPFLSGGALWGERASDFTVALPAAGTWPSTMKMTVLVPGPNGQTVPLDFLLTPSASPRPGGMTLVIEPQLFGAQQRQEVWARLDGDRFFMQPFALPLSPTGVADAATVEGAVTVIDDASGSVTEVQGTLRIGGPGINIPGVPFTISLP